MSDRGILVVVSGFSGAGKGTLMNALLDKYPNYALSVSVTTRQPREGEKEGIHYFYRTKEEFEEYIANDRLIEYAQYVKHYYGTPKKYVEEQLASGKDVILEIEVQGALKVKEKMPETLLLFVTPPSADELKKRLEGRGTEQPEIIQSRLEQASREAKYMPDYDYILINDVLDDCVCQMHNLIQSQHNKTEENQAFIGQIQSELKVFLKGE
jgi:guanylate kinase